MNTIKLPLLKRQYLELEKLALGAFAPLNGFMRQKEFVSVVDNMRLPDHSPFPLPVVLDVSEEQAQTLKKESLLILTFDGVDVGEVQIEDVYTCDKSRVTAKVFGTDDVQHPGVSHFLSMGDWFVGGAIKLYQRVVFEFSEYELTPAETVLHFKKSGWNTIVGFQTRNVPHRAHEYLLRLALEQADGLFIQPLVGRKKIGDYCPEAILEAYNTLVNGFLPKERVLLGVLSTSMRYAGPREAIFHAIVRRNYGCTHFIVGRDHAGVGNYYGKYEAHDLTRQFDGELGIDILRFAGPFYCRKCDGIVTERTCPHFESEPQYIQEISGSYLRAMLSDGTLTPPGELLRSEVLESIRHIQLFIDEETE